MHAHVAHDAVAVLHERSPPARMLEFVVRPHRRGACPKVVVEVLRGLRVGRVVLRPHVVVAADFGVPDLAEHAVLHDALLGLDQVRGRAPLQTDLHHAVVLARRREHGLAFQDVDADRLLAVDVGTRLARGDHRQRVPVIRRRDQDEIEFLLLQHLAVVRVQPRLLAGLLALSRQFGCGLERATVHVAQPYHLDWIDLDQAEEVDLAVPARAHDSYFAGSGGGSGARNQQQAAGRGAHELATVSESVRHGQCPSDEFLYHNLLSPAPCSGTPAVP